MRRADGIVELLRLACGRPRVHGNGFIQLDLTPTMRMHVWGDARIPAQQTSTPIHDHKFGFTSFVIAGALRDVRYESVVEDRTPTHQAHEAVMRHGEDTILRPITGGRVRLVERSGRLISAGDYYSVAVGEIHESQPLQPSVTVIVKDGKTLSQGGPPPLVFVPLGVIPSNEFDRYGTPVDELWHIMADVFARTIG